MNEPNNQQATRRTGELVLIRLLSAGKKFGRSDMEKWLTEHVANPIAMPGGEWRTMLDEVLVVLRSSGSIDAKGLRLTDQGRLQAWAALQIEPRAGNVRWNAIYNRFLMAKVLGVRPQSSAEWEKLGSTDGLRAAILVKHHELPGKAIPTITQALESLAWKQLQIGCSLEILPGKKFTRDNVLRVLLMKAQPAEPKEALPAMAVLAPNHSLRSLRIQVVSCWVHETAAPAFDLDAFAQQVRQISTTSTNGHYGESKVFIGHIWECFRQQHVAKGMSREEFNAHLVDANREGKLTLSRADLVAAMSPSDVASSEIKTPYADFHFVRTDR